MTKQATRVGDSHMCPASTGAVPHVGGVVIGGGPRSVSINGRPAACRGDLVQCGDGSVSPIVAGSPTVLIDGSSVARVGDLTAHGGVILSGSPTVTIGDAPVFRLGALTAQSGSAADRRSGRSQAPQPAVVRPPAPTGSAARPPVARPPVAVARVPRDPNNRMEASGLPPNQPPTKIKNYQLPAQIGRNECFNTVKKSFHAIKLGVGGGGDGYQIATSEDAQGHITSIDPKAVDAGRRYIDSELDQGHPVMVGVTYKAPSGNNDKLTDHWVAITGRGTDEHGNRYYKFSDPGANDRHDREDKGRFFVDVQGVLVGNRPNHHGLGPPPQYEVTHVRRSRSLP